MWIMLLIFSSISFADDMASERYCFSSPSRAQTAKQKFEMIQVPSDVANMDEQCLVIQMKPHRRELIQRYILSTFPEANVSFSSAEIRRDPCRLKVEKEKQRTTDDLNIEFNKQQGQVMKIESKVQGNEVMEIETIKDFELTVDQDQIKGSCKAVTPNRYSIEIEIKKNSKPIVPVGLPPGSIVILNQPPADQETATIKTELQLERGERINIGDVVKQLKDKDRSVDIKPNVEIGNTQQNVSERVFLSLQ